MSKRLCDDPACTDAATLIVSRDALPDGWHAGHPLPATVPAQRIPWREMVLTGLAAHDTVRKRVQAKRERLREAGR